MGYARPCDLNTAKLLKLSIPPNEKVYFRHGKINNKNFVGIKNNTYIGNVTKMIRHANSVVYIWEDIIAAWHEVFNDK